MNLKAIVYIAGVHLIFCGLTHIGFSKIFNWEEELPKMSPENRACIQILNHCLMLFWYMAGALYILFADEIISTSIGKAILTGICIFWVIRLFIIQPIYVGFKTKDSWVQIVIFITGLALSIVPLVFSPAI